MLLMLAGSGLICSAGIASKWVICKECARIKLHRLLSSMKDNMRHAEELFMVTHVDSAFAVHQREDLWLLDSSCTNHMSPCLFIFRSLEKSCITQVKIGNGELLAVKGKGTAAVKSISGIKLLENVLYVPEIAYNLLSVGQLIEAGFSLLFEEGKCDVKDYNGSLLLNVEMKNKSFPLYIGDSN